MAAGVQGMETGNGERGPSPEPPLNAGSLTPLPVPGRGTTIDPSFSSRTHTICLSPSCAWDLLTSARPLPRATSQWQDLLHPSPFRGGKSIIFEEVKRTAREWFPSPERGGDTGINAEKGAPGEGC